MGHSALLLSLVAFVISCLLACPLSAQWYADLWSYRKYIGVDDTLTVRLQWHHRWTIPTDANPPLEVTAVDSVKGEGCKDSRYLSLPIELKVALPQTEGKHSRKLLVWHNGNAVPDTVLYDFVMLPTTRIVFDTVDLYLPPIVEGESIHFKWPFRNVGDKPALLEVVKWSWGGMTMTWPKEPIAPGESSYLYVSTSNVPSPGMRRKSITLRYNGDPPILVLQFQFEVLPKPEESPEETDR